VNVLISVTELLRDLAQYSGSQAGLIDERSYSKIAFWNRVTEKQKILAAQLFWICRSNDAGKQNVILQLPQEPKHTMKITQGFERNCV